MKRAGLAPIKNSSGGIRRLGKEKRSKAFSIGAGYAAL
jgi:hypothetical protein